MWRYCGTCEKTNMETSTVNNDRRVTRHSLKTSHIPSDTILLNPSTGAIPYDLPNRGLEYWEKAEDKRAKHSTLNMVDAQEQTHRQTREYTPKLLNSMITNRSISTRSKTPLDQTTQDLVRKINNIHKDHFEKTLLNNGNKSNYKLVNISLKKLSYELNISKSLAKKQNACNRPIICDTKENDGSITFNCQAGIYELIKRAALMFYMEQHSPDRKVDVEMSQDKVGNFTQATVKIAPVTSNRTLYSVNLYHTTSTMLLNGKGLKTFFDRDWPIIEDTICGINDVCRGTDPLTLNEHMKQSLQQALYVLKQPKVRKGSNKSTTRQHVKATTTHHNPHEALPAAETLSTFQPPTAIQTLMSKTTLPSATDETQVADQQPEYDTLQFEPDRDCQQEAICQQNIPLPPGEAMQPDTLQYDNNTEDLQQDSATTMSRPAVPQPRQNPRHMLTDETRIGNTSPTIRIDQDTEFSMYPNEDLDRHTGVCFSCLSNSTKLQTEINTLQRKLKSQDKTLVQREKDLQTKISQYQNSKSYIMSLEAQVKQLQETNRLLNERVQMLQQNSTNNIQSSINTPAPNNNNDTPNNRLNEIEAKLQDLRIAQLEERLERINHRGNNNTPHIQPSPPPVYHQIHPYQQIQHGFPAQSYHFMHPGTNQTLGQRYHPYVQQYLGTPVFRYQHREPPQTTPPTGVFPGHSQNIADMQDRQPQHTTPQPYPGQHSHEQYRAEGHLHPDEKRAQHTAGQDTPAPNGGPQNVSPSSLQNDCIRTETPLGNSPTYPGTNKQQTHMAQHSKHGSALLTPTPTKVMSHMDYARGIE